MFKRKGLIAILTLLLVCSLSFNVLGAGALIDIQAQLHTGINVMLHGKKFEPVETDGSKIIPIIYKGRTYLPLRATAEAVGLEVTWDQNTQTAYLGDVAGEVNTGEIKYVNATQEFKNSGHSFLYLKSRNPELLTLPTGEVFEFGYTRPAGEAGTAYLVLNTNFEYQKFTAKIWVDKTKEADGSYWGDPYLKIVDENNISMGTFNVEWGKLYEIELDIADVKELEITVSGDKSIIGEPRLGK